MTLYADANSSYDAPHAIRLGRLLEQHNYAMFEEPCEFDDLWATKQVSDALHIPVGLGEQEFSLRRFQWVEETSPRIKGLLIEVLGSWAGDL